MPKLWHYNGDVNIEYGGTFVRLTEWPNGYAEVVEVTDMNSACGWRGGIMVEQRSVPTPDDSKRLDTGDRMTNHLMMALDCLGMRMDDFSSDIITSRGRLFRGSTAWRVGAVLALNEYGYRDTDSTLLLQTERDGPMRIDGWQAQYRLPPRAKLANYLRKHVFAKL